MHISTVMEEEGHNISVTIARGTPKRETTSVVYFCTRAK